MSTFFNRSLLNKTARIWGVQPSYFNIEGKDVWAPHRTIHQLLQGLSQTELKNDKDLIQINTLKFQSLSARGLDWCQVLWQGEKQIFHYYSKFDLAPSTVKINIRLENGEKINEDAKIINIKNYKFSEFKKITFEVNKPIAIGYHQLSLEGNNNNCLIICAPQKLQTDEKIKKTWGPFVPLYAVRSKDNWGIGDFNDLKKISDLTSNYGAQWLGALPMLAGNFDKPDCDPSPYSSLSRLFWNEIYLDVPKLVTKYENQKAKEIISSKGFQDQIQDLRSKDFVDYYPVYQNKKSILKLLSESFFTNGLDESAVFKKFAKENPDYIKYSQFRSPDYADQRFHQFVQFEMNQALADYSTKNGPGLYMDYPVGVNDSGYDYKEYRKVFFGEVSVGAPPEPVFQLGQDWGFPAFHPQNIREEGYNYFRRTLNQHFRYSKILRMDHVMGLHRIYAVPKGFSGKDGAYIRFHSNEFFAVACIEAHRNNAVLIGENLGTVPTQVNQMMQKRNIHGMWIYQFEFEKEPSEVFKNIPENSLAGLNTHDMPMMQAFFKTSHLDLIAKLGILGPNYVDTFRNSLNKFLQKWEKYFSSKDFLLQVIEKIAASKIDFFVINLEDLWKEERPQNIPGTWKEYPNWRKKFLLDTDQWLEDPQVRASFEILKQKRGK